MDIPFSVQYADDLLHGHILIVLRKPTISDLKNLRTLDLSNNGFHGKIPFSIFTLPSLSNLIVSSNQFTGHIGEISAYSLRSLDVSNNKLHGPIPRSIFQLQNLTLMNFSHNCLSENVLWHHLSWKYMRFLDLSSNSLQGELLPSICNANTLDILNLSHNNFTGTIPHCIVSSNLTLSVLDLQNNSFSGIVPESFEVGNDLRTLNLNGNFLEGSLPRSLVNCTRLRVLDLGNNNIEDVFPHWLEALEELQVLVLRGNKFHGFIPSFKDNRSHAFHMLRVLDLSSNNLKGPLPASFFQSFEAMRRVDGKTRLQYLNYANSSYEQSIYEDSIDMTWKGCEIHLQKILTVFTSIDLSNNMFDGEIPQVIGEFHALKGLNFSHNRLIGAIPISIGNLRNLEWLDLSSNNFTGRIPTELTNLNFLEVLNLSKNELEGCIPRGQQLETFSSDSFKGNKDLRGFQLMIPCNAYEERQEPLPSSGDGFEFGWKPVVLGYVCGAAFGAMLFQVIMFTGKPQWVVSLVNDPPKRRKRRVRKCT
ncbi:receptor-like protein 9DC3 [Neltuma alba]|uniref:receptor-like protein 9DC3 n=1 Tax=Neltuma alba TaxID=207710 RepID=UPI0010A5717B|nr:receptor-like protein 9DC3 [Prosopis alba]